MGGVTIHVKETFLKKKNLQAEAPKKKTLCRARKTKIQTT